MPAPCRSRRRLLQAFAASTFAHTFSPALTRAQAPATYVRRDIEKLRPNGPEMNALRKGVASMKARSKKNPNDQIGWDAQAKIHGASCAHANWFFLPWHRAYVSYFEK